MLTFGTESTGSSSSNSTKVGEGVYVQKATIREARCEKNCAMIEGSQYLDDIGLRLKLDIGKDWLKDFYTGGNFKREGADTSWGSAFKVKLVLDSLGIQGKLDGEMVIPQSVTDQLIGREIFVLQYVARLKADGKPGYNDYNIVVAQRDRETEESAINRLYDRFMNDLEKGFMKKYRPELLDSSSDGATGSTTLTPSGEGDEDAPW
jgi:hypothetical protein